MTWEDGGRSRSAGKPACTDRAHGITILSNDKPICRVCYGPVDAAEVAVRAGVCRLDEAIMALARIERDGLLAREGDAPIVLVHHAKAMLEDARKLAVGLDAMVGPGSVGV